MIPFKKNNDLRVQKTHYLLWTSFEAMLSQPGRNFSSITVNEICEKAMIHRTTFYKHFEDKFDLLSFCMSQFHSEFCKWPLKDRLLNPFQTMEIHPRKALVSKIIQIQRNDLSYNNFINNLVKKTLMQDLSKLNINGNNFSIPAEIATEFYCGTLFSLTTWWEEKNGCTISPAKMDEYFRQMISRGVFSI